MLRREFIERHSRQIYGGFATDDAEITFNLINSWLTDAVGLAAKTCYKESIQIEGIGYVNNSFYTTFKGIAVVADENLTYKITLPEIPLGIGKNEGISTLQFKDSNGNVSLPVIWLNENQKAYFQSMRPIPNKILAYPEGTFVYAISTLQLYAYTATVSMISGGDGTDLDSTLNVPADYFPVMVEYLKAQLAFERAQVRDISNDGSDNK